MKKAFEQQLPLWVADESDHLEPSIETLPIHGEQSSGVDQQEMVEIHLDLVFQGRTVIPEDIAEELVEAESLLEMDEIERLNRELSVLFDTTTTRTTSAEDFTTLTTTSQRRTSCTAHTLQLVVKDGLKVLSVRNVNASL